jgi:hypothetical protein
MYIQRYVYMHTYNSLHGWHFCLFVFSSEIQYSLFILRICSVFPSSVRNVLRTVYSHRVMKCKRFSELTLNSVEWRTKLFYFICVFISDIFNAFVVLAEHRSGCPHTQVICNISLHILWTVYSLFFLSEKYDIYMYHNSTLKNTISHFHEETDAMILR